VSYRVLIQPTAVDDLDGAFRWISRTSADRAATWLDEIFTAIQTLREFPRRCPRAPEDDAFSEEIRQLLHGDFRTLFTVDGDAVRVLHVRHGARRPLTPG
jgi:plasmid stabilization system protein ParE